MLKHVDTTVKIHPEIKRVPNGYIGYGLFEFEEDGYRGAGITRLFFAVTAEKLREMIRYAPYEIIDCAMKKRYSEN